MNTAATHTEFKSCLKQIEDDYQRTCANTIAQLGERYRQETGDAPGAALAELVEAQARALFIDRFLDALNWSVAPARSSRHGQLVIEARVDPTDGDERYQLDYLGHDFATDCPLLLVEAKRPRLELPQPSVPAGALAAANSLAIANAFNGDRARITKQWQGHVEQLQGYVRAISHRVGNVPRRALITNSRWFVILTNPGGLLDGRICSPDEVIVIPTPERAQDEAYVLFEHLSYGSLVGPRSLIHVSELCSALDKRDLTDVAFGLRLIYSDTPGFDGRVPRFRIRPVVLLFAQRGRWVVVESENQDQDLPERESDLPAHLAWTEDQCQLIKREIDSWAGRTTILREVERHFASPDFSSVPAIMEAGSTSNGAREFTLISGSNPHFLRLLPSVPNCPYHGYDACAQAGAALPDKTVMRASIAPRSFYATGMRHHCAHRGVLEVKRQRVAGPLVEECGPRSNNHGGRLGGSFCEIFAFEEHLCCRTCVFECVCSKSGSFRLPCNPPAPAVLRIGDDMGESDPAPGLVP